MSAAGNTGRVDQAWRCEAGCTPHRVGTGRRDEWLMTATKPKGQSSVQSASSPMHGLAVH